MRCTRTAALVVTVLTTAAGCAVKPAPATRPSIPASFAPAQLADTWDRERVSWAVPPLIRHADVEAKLKEVQAATPDFFRLEPIGASVEGRSINHLWFGSGRLHVLLWSQMHGDEPTATAALFDIFEYFRRHRTEPGVRAHPVGAHDPRRADAQPGRRRTVPAPQRAGHRHQPRRAAHADARRPGRSRPCATGSTRRSGSTCTTRAGGRRSAKTGQPATISLLSVAFDEARTESAGPPADQEDVRGHPRRPRAAGAGARSRATTTSSRCGRSGTT